MKVAAIIVALILLFSLCIWQFALSPRDRMLIFASKLQMKVGEQTRAFYVAPPANGSTPKRLFIGLHAYGDTPRRFGYYTGLHNVVESEDLVIYPQSVSPTSDQRSGWNAGFCCGSGWKQNVDDVEFLSRIAENFKQQYGENAPVYVLGFSNGGMMTQRLLSEKPELFAGGVASGSAAGVIGNTLQPKSSDTPLLLMHGERDGTVLFTGGASTNEPDFPWLSFDETSAVWRGALGDKLQTKIYPELTHQWPDWRIFKVWHTKPAGTQEAVTFLNR